MRWKKVSAALGADREDQRDGFSGNDADQRDGFSNIREDRRDGFRKIRACQRDGCSQDHDGFGKGDADQREGYGETRADCRDGFGFHSRRRTCKCQEVAHETENASRNNRFFALTAIESEDDEEVNAV